MSSLPKGITKDDIAGIECKHAVFVKSARKKPNGVPDDLVFIKERIHLKDGTQVPNTRFVVNYKRPFWITKPGFRKHNEKKEWEKIERLQKFECTQSELPSAVKRALNIFSPTMSMRDIAMSPYLYGSDVTSTTIIKHKYMTQWPGLFSKNSIAVLDAETDVFSEDPNKRGEPILLSVTYKDKAIFTALKRWIVDTPDYEEELNKKCWELMPDVMEERKLKIEFHVCDTPLDMIKMCIARTHEWMPDFLSIYNINFDFPIMFKIIEKYGGNAADIFSDPSVPPEFRYAYYKEGTDKKVTASGDESTLSWYDRWHTVICPASWYAIDQACVFRRLRSQLGKEPSMALDALLKKYTNTSKLKTEEASHLGALEWHVHMQKFKKVVYGVYNLKDCVSCEQLDEEAKVGDLSTSLPMQAKWSDFDKFASQPRRAVDDLHFFCLEQEGRVIASTPKDIGSKFDTMVVSINDWIITLPAHNIEENGLQCIEEIPTLRTCIRVGVYD